MIIENGAVLEACFDGTEVPDEHAYAVFFLGALGGEAGFDARFERRSPMLIDWDERSSPCPDGHDREHAEAYESSPRCFHIADLAPQLVRKARASGHLFLRKVCLRSILSEGSQRELEERTWRLAPAAAAAAAAGGEEEEEEEEE